MPDGLFLGFWSVPVVAVALVCFAALREHGTPAAKRAAYVFLGIAALPALFLALIAFALVAALATG
ncbi:hypothetical protein [Kitasatospora sp. MY 5-36]|uniref:hypothetical protein n=1 Tax=Kitasatospora sp. MY 5-36 TaxID=1678027 RepID=UPI000671134A|nr:hypothetical protein [Kitasatospora sp. MY 5-36]